jgi:hypothetical protein
VFSYFKGLYWVAVKPKYLTKCITTELFKVYYKKSLLNDTEKILIIGENEQTAGIGLQFAYL